MERPAEGRKAGRTLMSRLKIIIFIKNLKLLENHYFLVTIISMSEKLSKVDIYNEDYVGVNHAYVQIYKFYKRLMQAEDADEEVMSVLREILLVFNPTLDRIKSEMTVKTRYKEEKAETPSAPAAKAVNGDSSPVILHGNFTGD